MSSAFSASSSHSAFSGGSSRSAFGSSGSSGYPSSSPSLSLRELMLLKLAAAPQHQNKGFLQTALHGGGSILGEVGHPIGWTFHQIERPFHGVEQGIYDSLNTPLGPKGIEQFGKGFAHGFMKGDSPSGSQILKHDQHVGSFFKQHKIAAGVAGFGTDVLADPLSFVGFGVKGTKTAIETSRKLLQPSGWHDIVQSGKKLKELAAAGNPEHYKDRIALNAFDKAAYKSAKKIAAAKGEVFQSKNLGWLTHHFKENVTNIYEPGIATQREDLAAAAHWEGLRRDPRYKSLSLGGHQILQFGKNVALKEHNSALAKLFSNVARYGDYYPLSVVGQHSGIRTDVIDQIVKGAQAKGFSEKEINKEVQSYIKEFQHRRVKMLLARTEGIPTLVEDKNMKRILRVTARQVAKYHDVHGISFPDMASQIHQFNPDLIKHMKMEGQTEGTIAQKLRDIYQAHQNPEMLSKLSRIVNPDLKAKNFSDLGGEFKGTAISKKGKGFLAEYRNQYVTDPNFSPFLKKMEHARGILKRGYTGANPFGYAIRNSLTDVWNAALTHTPVVRGMARNAPRAYQMIKKYDKATEKLMRGEALDAAEKHTFMQVHKMHDLGILSGLFAKDVQEDKPLSVQLHPQSGRQIIRETKGRRLLHGYATGAVHFNETRENTGRMAHFLYRIGKGESAQEAAQYVKAAHFDYQDITPFEQHALKSIFPFYTWYRKNIPFQMRMFAEKPGQFLRYTQLQNESQQASGDKKPGLLPDYLKDSPSVIRLPFGKNLYANPAIGSNDLQTIEHPINDLEQKIGPPLNLPLAYYSGKDNFAGNDLSNTRLAPTNPLLGKILSDIPGYNHIPGFGVGKTQRVVKGKEVSSYGITPWSKFLAGQIPGANMLLGANPVSVKRNGLPSVNTPAGPVPTGPLLSYFAGQSVSAPDQQLLKSLDEFNTQTNAKNQLQKLYDSGALKKRPHRQTRFDRLFAHAAGG